MKDELAVIIPSRGRPEALEDLYGVFDLQSSQLTEIFLGLDEDDLKLNDYLEFGEQPNLHFVVGPRLGMNGTLNKIAVEVAKEFKYIGFQGDDHRNRTWDWDGKFIQESLSAGTRISYGNDLIQGPNLPTAVYMTSDIVRTLGYMAPPELKHLYLDNFWRDLGIETGILDYFGDIIIEHLHPSVGKAEWTEQYKEVNDPKMYDHDRTAYEEYKAGRFKEDVQKIKDLL